MKKFQIFRYLKQWKYVVLVTAVLGCILVYWYGDRNQTYTATAVIEYTNGDAVNGNNPDGSPIDKSEITSAAVITDVISELGLGTNVENIRSKCDVKEIIPDDEQQKMDAALEQGTEYTYFPTKYQISFTVGSDNNRDYARDVLDQILTNYFSWYCQKYVDYAVFSNNAENISAQQYDYIDCVDMLYDTAEEIKYYLDIRADSYGNFRSAVSGYSFADLSDSYENIRDGAIAKLYAYVLNNRLVNNKELLIKRYENRVAQYQLQIQNYENHITEAKALLDQFGEKTLEENDINYSFGGGKGSNEGLIINNVEEWYSRNNGSNKVETTYDKLINQYVTLQTTKIYLETKLNKANEILSVFRDDTIQNDTGSDQAKAASQQIDAVVSQMNDLYAIVLPTIDEFNEKNGSENLAMRSSISVKEKFNMNVFILLAAAFFLVVGCGGAVLLGRLGDFVDYFLYTDKKTSLPNRNRCDIVIESYERGILPDHFVCMVYKMELQFRDKPDYTRKDGDKMLHQFGQILKNVMHDAAFVGYNNDGMFICFMENCTTAKAENVAERVSELIADYNAGEAVYPIVFRAGIAQTTEDHVYGVRDLLRAAIGKAFHPPVDKQAGQETEKQSKERDGCVN